MAGLVARSGTIRQLHAKLLAGGATPSESVGDRSASARAFWQSVANEHGIEPSKTVSTDSEREALFASACKEYLRVGGCAVSSLANNSDGVGRFENLPFSCHFLIPAPCGLKRDSADTVPRVPILFCSKLPEASDIANQLLMDWATQSAARDQHYSVLTADCSAYRILRSAYGSSRLARVFHVALEEWRLFLLESGSTEALGVIDDLVAGGILFDVSSLLNGEFMRSASGW